MIFVLGAKGFVGSAIVRRLSVLGVDFTPITRANYAQHIGSTCDILVNASGNSRKYFADREPVYDLGVSVVGVLRALRDFRAGGYVHLSSVDVYNDVSNPLNNTEDAAIEPSRLSPYGFSKYLAELVTRRYAKKYLLIRLGGMVGPGLKKNPIYDLLHSGSLYVHADSLYQYMTTDKVAQIVVDLIQAGVHDKVFNLCGDDVVSPRQVAGWLGLPDVAYPGESRPERYEVNIEKIKQRYCIPNSAEAVRSFIASCSREPLRKPIAGMEEDGRA